MRFPIAALLLITVYAAILFASLRSPNIFWDQSARLAAGFSCAISIIIGFDRRSTPFFAFGVFGILAALCFPIPNDVVAVILKQVSLSTGAIEYTLLQSILQNHFIIVSGIIGFCLGVAIRGRKVAQVGEIADKVHPKI